MQISGLREAVLHPPLSPVAASFRLLGGARLEAIVYQLLPPASLDRPAELRARALGP